MGVEFFGVIVFFFAYVKLYVTSAMFSSLLISNYFFYYLNYFKIPKIWYLDELCIAQKFNCYIYISANLAHPLKMVMHRQAMHNVFSVRKPKYGQKVISHREKKTFKNKTSKL